jgi:hypothetical protein
MVQAERYRLDAKPECWQDVESTGQMLAEVVEGDPSRGLPAVGSAKDRKSHDVHGLLPRLQGEESGVQPTHTACGSSPERDSLRWIVEPHSLVRNDHVSFSR